MRWDTSRTMWVKNNSSHLFTSSLHRVISTVKTWQNAGETNIIVGIDNIPIFGISQHTKYNFYLTKNNLVFYGTINQDLTNWEDFEEGYTRALRLMPSQFASSYRYQDDVFDIFLKYNRPQKISSNWIKEGF